ncbi:MAG: eukaryotic-like serine/threonine-protein kinase, partial [Gammaproteobacteria bacterium]|nr:eukaryotic-like serine/threonine-protein kinase [Gammaproteobacteria bacterium]
MSTPESREKAVFHAALDVTDPVQRREFLDEACAGDVELRAAVDELLKRQGDAEQFFAEGASSLMPLISELESVAVLMEGAAFEEAPGTMLGRYKVIRKIGEGGFGVVYMAEQEEPVRRRVALKVVKLGMDTRSVIARFEAERQALALMEHPNIARVFDAGATATGRPYFVMELVQGVKITEYCDRNQIGMERRLELFMRVCQAIQHAHQKGIIHRDIKPSNILVTLQEGVPVPKVIDFGIATATEERLTDKTLLTACAQWIGTPAYMSPEQMESSSLGIDTRSDIYSLGVLLYELLTGQTPFDIKELLESGVDEMRRTLREREPRTPSSRLSTLGGEELTRIAIQRHIEPPQLLSQLRGDLDWIAMKALEKDRTRRYETANGLAMDIQRYLDDEPVVARPPSTVYRFQKAIRRNRLMFSAAAAVVAALVAGIAISTWQTAQARKAQRETEAARYDEQRRLMEARAAEKKAQAQALAARRTAYSSDMNAVVQALQDYNLGRARVLLNRQKPQAGERDLRDWEWRYLWGQARADDHEIFFAGARWSARPLSFSADGQMLAREVDGGHTVVTDLISHRAILERPNARLPVFAHHRNLLAFVAKDPATTNDIITLLDMATQKEVQPVKYNDSTQWIGLTPDDRQLLTVSLRPGTDMREGFSSDLTAWEVDTGRQLWQ